MRSSILLLLTDSSVPKVLIGMPVLNRAERLPNTLEALRSLDYPKELLRIIFVDGGSKDNTREILRNFKKSETEYREIQIDEGGFEILPKGRNDVISKIREDEEFLWFIDSDVIVNRDSLKQLVSLSSKGYDFCNLFPVESDQKPPSSGTVETDTSMLACALIRTSLVRKTGLFDERLVLLPEDTDYCLRARRTGSKILVDYSHYVLHQSEGRTQDFTWKRWGKRQRRIAAFTLMKLIQYGVSNFPHARSWFVRLAAYSLIFISTVLAFFISPLLFLPLIFYFLFEIYRVRQLSKAASRTFTAFIMLPVTLFASGEVALELKSKRYRKRRNQKLLGINTP